MIHAHPRWPSNLTAMITNTVPRPLHWSLLLGTAIAITLFLYFIDEGRYSLEGLFTVGNIIAMGIYLVGLVLGLFLTARLFAKREPGPLRTALVLSIGSLVGFVIGLGLILGLGALQMVG